ncbi:gamma-glutamyltranspeptidase [Mycena pura]|uniref:Glutathione hydrolase n=1 Tax=Mycena pura TaxID=153505 RepID=A0AAD6YBA0_9AGAR|nr:gamma-glutamyltranspeptidase [Mycena pura]
MLADGTLTARKFRAPLYFRGESTRYRSLVSILVFSLLSGCRANADAHGQQGAVVSEVKECSEHGVEMLKCGGSAADAIISATGLCVGTISAYHSGIGGGGFMLVRSAQEHGAKYEMIDFRETMPALGNDTMYSANPDPNASTIGGLALPWPHLFQRAIKTARDGYVVDVDLNSALNATIYPFLVNDTLWAEVYAPNGTLARLGDTIYRKRYATTLETIAEHGADVFYNGSIANTSSKAALNAGGILSTADLAGYKAILRTPRNITYRNRFRIFSTVAPSSGTVVLSALKIFDAYADFETNLSTHALIQATKFGYGQRTTYGDPEFTKNVSQLEGLYLEDSTVEAIRRRLPLNTTFPPEYYDPSNYTVLVDHGTSHMAAVDRWGNAVSLTTTINQFWGSQVMTEDGIILNDEMDNFSSSNGPSLARNSSVNSIAPFKRPLSSIASSIAEDLNTGALVMATGAAGGSHIITATLQNLHNHLDLGASARESVFAPRWHDELTPTTYFEGFGPDGDAAGFAKLGIAAFPNATVEFLRGLWYKVDGMASMSTSHVIVRSKNGTYEAANDPRRPAGGGSAY